MHPPKTYHQKQVTQRVTVFKVYLTRTRILVYKAQVRGLMSDDLSEVRQVSDNGRFRLIDSGNERQ